MTDSFSRTRLLLGGEAMDKLAAARVAVFGIGGVGGYVCEGLVRCGVGAFELVDGDKVSTTNINRQIIASASTVGRYKCDVMKERMLDINPEVKVTVRNGFFMPENADDFDFGGYDYVVDAVDTVAAKIEIILKARQSGVPVISCMGAGNKLDPTAYRVADIYQTKMCPLARIMRGELRKRGVESLKVVYSEEPPLRRGSDNASDGDEISPESGRVWHRDIPGSVSFVPSVVGMIAASEVVKDLIKQGT